jgi:hypothetical protein
VLVVERLVPEASRDDPALRRLLPVVVAVPGVVRAGEQEPLQRLGHEHLAAGGNDGRVELGEQALRVPIRREHDVVGLEFVDRVDAVVLAQLGAGLGGSLGQPAHPAGRLKRSIGRMEDRAVEPAARRVRQLGAPFGRVAVLAEGLVLGLELGPFGGIGSQAEASGAPEGIAASSSSRSRWRSVQPQRPFARSGPRSRRARS